MVSILQWSRRLGTMGKFWMSNPVPEQYKAVIPLFLRLVTDRQHTCNSVDKWVSIPASSVTSLYPQLTKFLSLSSLAFYRTLLAPLSFANSDLRYVFFYSKSNSEEPRQNSITTWNSYSWYFRKIIQSLNYEENLGRWKCEKYLFKKYIKY